MRKLLPQRSMKIQDYTGLPGGCADGATWSPWPGSTGALWLEFGRARPPPSFSPLWFRRSISKETVHPVGIS